MWDWVRSQALSAVEECRQIWGRSGWRARVIFLALIGLGIASSVYPSQAPSPGSPQVVGPGAPAQGGPYGSAVDRDLAQMRAMATPEPATSRAHPAISDEARSQADLYAGGFVQQLLTQDYRTPRVAKLAWVQAESAQSSERLVVGLVPAELRPRMAVWSVQHSGATDQAVPPAQVWAALGQAGGFTRVRIVSVTVPGGWAQAVTDGQITDSDTTAREVTAVVDLHTTTAGRAVLRQYGVTARLHLAGPPFGFVSLVTFEQHPGEY